MKIYVRALGQASDYDENSPDKAIDPLYLKLVPQTDDKRRLEERLATVLPAELDEVCAAVLSYTGDAHSILRQLTPDEKAFWRYTTALAEWLEPHHSSTRPPKIVPLADATRANTDTNGSAHAAGNSTTPLTTEASASPTWQDPPELVSRYFDGIYRL